MTDAEILGVLKIDLGISAPALDEYLGLLITAARDAIRSEGVVLRQCYEDAMLIEMYAAWLYRKRREESAAMPRSLRWALNNRLFGKKGGDGDG